MSASLFVEFSCHMMVEMMKTEGFYKVTEIEDSTHGVTGTRVT